MPRHRFAPSPSRAYLNYNTPRGAEWGIEHHANTPHGYEGIYYGCNYDLDGVSALAYDGAKNSWYGYKREISNDRPPMVYHDYWYPGDPEFRFHWKAGVGVWPRIVDVKTPAFLPIAGLAGEGKTTFLKRLAYELWRAGKTVYFVSAQEVGRASVASGLRVLLRKASEPVYVMLDDVELLGASECSACLKVMAEVRKPCVLVGTLNRATWTQMQLFQDAQVEIVVTLPAP